MRWLRSDSRKGAVQKTLDQLPALSIAFMQSASSDTSIDVHLLLRYRLGGEWGLCAACSG
jgi:hypothetical protein